MIHRIHLLSSYFTKMSLKQWMQSNGVFDRELLQILPQYGIHDPSNDLCTLTQSQWTEIKQRQLRDRSHELRQTASRQRLEAKLRKIEKLWKLSRSTKMPKMTPNIKSTNITLKKPRSKISGKQEVDDSIRSKRTKSVIITSKSNRRPFPRIDEVPNDRISRLLDELDAVKLDKMRLDTEWTLKYKVQSNKLEALEALHRETIQKVHCLEADKMSMNNDLRAFREEMTSEKSKFMDREREWTQLHDQFMEKCTALKRYENERERMMNDLEQIRDYNRLLKRNYNDLEVEHRRNRDTMDSMKAMDSERLKTLEVRNMEFADLRVKYEEVGML